jgi:hypothetical protein
VGGTRDEACDGDGTCWKCRRKYELQQVLPATSEVDSSAQVHGSVRLFSLSLPFSCRPSLFPFSIPLIRITRRLNLPSHSASTLVEPLTECLSSGFLASLVFHHLFSLPPLLFLPIHIALWFYIDITLYRTLLPASPARSTSIRPPSHDGPGLAYFKAWAVREVLALPIWMFAMAGNTVGWRDEGTVYRVRRDGSVRALREGEKEDWVERVWAKVEKRWSSGRAGYTVLSPDDVEALGQTASHAEVR